MNPACGFLFLFLFPATIGDRYVQVMRPNHTMFSYSYKWEERSYELDCARMCTQGNSCVSFAYVYETCRLFSFYLPEDMKKADDSLDLGLAFIRMGICQKNYSPFAGMCWRFGNSKLNHHNARAECSKDQAALLQIETPAKMAAFMLFKDIAELPWGKNSNYWLGSSDRETEGRWTWSNGENVTLWCPGNPDNKRGEDCMVFRSTYGCLNDVHCGRGSLYVCEKNQTS